MQSAAPSPKPEPSPQIRGGQCRICLAPLKLRDEVEKRLSSGESVQSIERNVRQLFPSAMQGITISSIYRHRNLHYGPTLRAAAKMSDADRLVRRKVDLAKAVLADKVDPQAYFGPAALAQDIARTAGRLEVASDDALQTRQYSALAGLSSSLLRSHELRGKLGGTIAPEGQVNLSIAVQTVTDRLQPLLASAQPDRAQAARSLLGLPAITSPDFGPESRPEEAQTIEHEPMRSSSDALTEPKRTDPPASEEQLGTRWGR